MTQTPATTVLCRDLAELNANIIAFSEEGYRIITVIDSQNGLYTIVAQEERDYQQLMTDLGDVIQNAVYEAGQPVR